MSRTCLIDHLSAEDKQVYMMVSPCQEAVSCRRLESRYVMPFTFQRGQDQTQLVWIWSHVVWSITARPSDAAHCQWCCSATWRRCLRRLCITCWTASLLCSNMLTAPATFISAVWGNSTVLSLRSSMMNHLVAALIFNRLHQTRIAKGIVGVEDPDSKMSITIVPSLPSST